MKPVVSFYLRTSSRSKKTKKSPVSISVRFEGKTLSYITGLDLKVEDYEASQKKNPDGEALQHSLQILMAQARMNAIIDLLDPYSSDAFAYIIKQARKEYSDIFLDLKFDFNASVIASKFLEEYQKSHPGIEISFIKQKDEAGNYPQLPTALLNYVEKVQGNLLPICDTKNVMLQRQEMTTGKVDVITAEDMGNGGNKTVQITQNFLTINTNGNGNGKNLALPDSRYNPRANMLEWMLNSMNKENGKGTDDSYLCAVRKLVQFLIEERRLEPGSNEKSYVAFTDIVATDPRQFEDWMLLKGSWGGRPMKPGGVATYMGYFIKAYKRAQQKGIITEDENPFAEYKVIQGDTLDRSLTEEELKNLMAYTPEKPKPYASGEKAKKRLVHFSEEKALDFWLFSFFGNGINFMDIGKLKWGKTSKEEFSFKRSKTRKSTRGYKDLEVKLTDPLKLLIKKYGTADKAPQNYVFPIVEEITLSSKPLESMTAEERATWIKQEHAEIVREVSNFTAQVNRYMRQIAEKLGIDTQKITTYSARHTFVNEAKEVMSEAAIAGKLGHKGRKVATVNKYYLLRVEKQEDELLKEKMASRYASKVA